MAKATPKTKEQRHLLDSAIVEDLAEEIVIKRHPGIEDRPTVFFGFTAATVALITPSLENLAQAYRQACRTRAGQDAARLFLANLLDALDVEA